MKKRKKYFPLPVTFKGSGDYGHRFMVRLSEISNFWIATVCNVQQPKIDYFRFLIADSCVFHFCRASLAL
jgi:hypothetical protein